MEDGWVETESPIIKDPTAGKASADIDDVDDIDMQDVAGNHHDEEAVCIIHYNNNI